MKQYRFIEWKVVKHAVPLVGRGFYAIVMVVGNLLFAIVDANAGTLLARSELISPTPLYQQSSAGWLSLGMSTQVLAYREPRLGEPDRRDWMAHGLPTLQLSLRPSFAPMRVDAWGGYLAANLGEGDRSRRVSQRLLGTAVGVQSPGLSRYVGARLLMQNMLSTAEGALLEVGSESRYRASSQLFGADVFGVLGGGKLTVSGGVVGGRQSARLALATTANANLSEDAPNFADNRFYWVGAGLRLSEAAHFTFSETITPNGLKLPRFGVFVSLYTPALLGPSYVRR